MFILNAIQVKDVVLFYWVDIKIILLYEGIEASETFTKVGWTDLTDEMQISFTSKADRTQILINERRRDKHANVIEYKIREMQCRLILHGRYSSSQSTWDCRMFLYMEQFIWNSLCGKISDQIHDIEEFIIQFMETSTESFFCGVMKKFRCEGV